MYPDEILNNFEKKLTNVSSTQTRRKTLLKLLLSNKKVLTASSLLLFFGVSAIYLSSIILNPIGTKTSRANFSVNVSEQVTQALNNNQKVNVLVKINTPLIPEGKLDASKVKKQRDDINTLQSKVISKIKGLPNTRVLNVYKTIPYINIEVDKSSLEVLKQFPLDILEINEGRTHKRGMYQTLGIIGATKVPSYAVDPTDEIVAVIDDGVDKNHPLLTGKVIREACVASVGGNSCPDGSGLQLGEGAAVPCFWAPTDCQHGTSVAGIIAGGNGASYNSKKISGVAEGAGIFAIQIAGRGYDNKPTYSEGDIIGALDLVIQSKDTFAGKHLASVTMSIAGGIFSSICDSQVSALSDMIINLRSVGIAPVVTAGNDGLTAGIESPACISSSISVSSVSKSDVIPDYANILPELTNLFLAPGGSKTANIDDGMIVAANGGFISVTGTSYSTPQVAAAIALLHKASPSSSLDEMIDALKTTGKSIKDLRSGASTKSFPRIQIDKAVSKLTGIESTNSCSGLTGSSIDCLIE